MLEAKTKWQYTDEIEDLSTGDDMSSAIFSELLLERGIRTEAEKEAFLSPDLGDFCDPASLHNMDRAVERIHRAVENGEKILVFGDYDADGICSTVLMMEALAELGANCASYIPNRFTEGYGPNEGAFREAHANGFGMIITVDTGIAADHEMSVASDLGLDVILTDHHEIQESLPEAYAIIHPKTSPEHPFKELAGVGVAFKLAWELLGYFPEDHLDLVAIGTIADLVPLLEENRILAYHGLKKLSATKREGLMALKDRCQIKEVITEEDIGFAIGPRLNAVGRLEDADMAVELLLTESREEARELADSVEELNRRRKSIVQETVAEAEEMIAQQHDTGIIVVAGEQWNEGVLGIVASRLTEKYDKPSIVLAISLDGNSAKGSARSIPAFDLFTNCMKINDVFTRFGGHEQAAGMSLPVDNISSLRERLSAIIEDTLSASDFKQVTTISRQLDITDIKESLIEDIQRLAPFGMYNPKPVFALENTPSEIRKIGSTGQHIKMQFKEGGHVLEAIGFGLGWGHEKIAPKTPVVVAGELGINEWNGYRKLQIVIKDMAVTQWQLFDRRGRNQPIMPQVAYNDSILAVGIRNSEAASSLGARVDFAVFGDPVDPNRVYRDVYILDLPESLTDLKHVIQTVQPSRIHACYHVNNGYYMKPFPKRQDFVWFYALIKKRGSLDMHKEMKQIMAMKGFSKENIIFIVLVFEDLGFVTTEKGVVYHATDPVKKNLEDSIVYQKRIQQTEIEGILYYSNYDTLKEWFQNCMDEMESVKEEEVTHGL